jgi:putative CocE/NonD family hydrolase
VSGPRHWNVRIPARDGVLLATDVYLPPGDGPHPAILGRTPYNKANVRHQRLADTWNARGYALVVQDVRGRGDSQGSFVPYRNEACDGADAVEWVAAQPWCTGDVILQGASYGGHSSWLTAVARPPSLRAMIVSVTPSDPFVEWPTGRSPMSICWYRMVDGRVMQPTDGIDWMQVYEHLPLLTMDERAGFSSEHWREDIAHGVLDEHWAPLCYQDRFGELDIAVLHISGWYDDEQIGTPRNFAGMVRHAASERARRGQRMIMGPWGHAVNTTRALGDVDFGPTAVIDLDRRMADFADVALGRGDPPDDDAPVRIFVMGINTWRTEQEWPLARTWYVEWFLHSGGNANSRFGDGRLTLQAPGGDEPCDTYLYDPARPVPFLTDPVSAQIGGPDDYSAIEQRGDVLCYTSDPLDVDTEFTGPVRLVLHVSSSAVDTDFTAKLVDVHPGGFCQRLCDSVVRGRLREGVDHEVPMEPGTVYELDIDMWNTCQVFRAGHRIRLEVSSSAFPKYDRNLNTGEGGGEATRMVVAENRVWHDAAHPSRLVLPLIPS